MKWFISGLMFLLPVQAKCNELEHFVTAGGIQTISYLGLRKALHVDNKPFALITSAIVSGGFSVMAEYSKPRFNNRTFEAAGLGILTSSVLMLSLDF